MKFNSRHLRFCSHRLLMTFCVFFLYTSFIFPLSGCSNPEQEKKALASSAQKMFDEQTNEKIKLASNAADQEKATQAAKERRDCESAEEGIEKDFNKLYEKKQFRDAMELVRPCAKINPIIKSLLTKSEIGFYIQTLNDKSISPESRLATLGFFEREYPQEAEKIQNLRSKLVEQNIKETKAAKLAAEKEEDRRKAQEAKQRKSEGVSIGMTPEDVRASSWGRPQSINRTTHAYGTREQWVYGGRNYLYFENGRLTAIQN